ncbi:DUF3857 domain-containing protein [Pleionea sp. CnH1-48]|uniref:DUF3857 domain-containing transglutaminase family protein n=1 Tax=Pleionea sp. CnH1-48 TaxID=2954494 RepID=UPI002098503D|nr:DUF3857 domain-containing protein [Pleionea sp. CnH1-48]MCO7223551.1 DUF3857 and transglutaminase domain-containing protein [Pleionea sp. CnH1-48]
MKSYLSMVKCCLFLSATLMSFSAWSEQIQSNGFSYYIDDAQPWVKPVSLKSKDVSKHDQSVAYLLSDSQVYINKNDYGRYKRYAFQAVSKQGLENISEFSISFQPDYQKFYLHYIRITRNGKLLDRTRSSDIRLVQREEEISRRMYNGYVTAMVLLEDIQVGDIVEYAFTINGRNPVYGEAQFSAFSLNWSVPVHQTNIRLLTDRELEHQMFNSDAKLKRITHSDNSIEYSLYRENVPAVYHEGEAPAWFDPYAYVGFTEYKNWGEVVDWAKPLYSFSGIKNKELLKKAATWKAQSKSKKEYAEKVIRFVQNDIRYFGIEIGVNSHKPTHPDEVFERKFGDCKDKTSLINELLRLNGIEAYPALVSNSTRKGIEDFTPQPGAFDHVISYIKLDGKDYWIDGTRTFQYGSLDNITASNFQKALVISDDSRTLTPIKFNDAMRSMVSIKEAFSADNYKDAVKLTITYVYSGSKAESVRASLDSKGKENFAKDYTNYYAKQFPSIAREGDIQLIDDQDGNRLTVQQNFIIKDFWDLSEERLTTPLYGDYIASYVAKPEVVSRNFPLANYHAIGIQQEVSMSFPEVIDWNIDTNAYQIENDAMKYQRKVDFEGREFKVKHSYESKQDHVSVEDVPDYVEKIKEIRDALYYSVWVSNEREEEDDLRGTLRSLLKAKRKQ